MPGGVGGSARPRDDIALRQWVAERQPCLFGRHAARRGLLTMQVVSDDPATLEATALSHRLAAVRSRWRRDMLAGRSLGLVVAWWHPALARGDGGQVAAAARFVSAFAGRPVAPGEVVLEDVYWPHPDGRHAWRWRVPVNLFAAAVGGSWAQARHVPRGFALAVNSVGQFAMATGPGRQRDGAGHGEPGSGWSVAFDDAVVRMSHRTIDNCAPCPRREPAAPGAPGKEPGGSGGFLCEYDVDAAVPAELFGGEPGATRRYRFTEAYGQRASAEVRGAGQESWQSSPDRACEWADLVALPLRAAGRRPATA